jgi:hypothetical protein
MEKIGRLQDVKFAHIPFKGFEALHIIPLRSIWLTQSIELLEIGSIIIQRSPPGSTPIAGTLPGHST